MSPADPTNVVGRRTFAFILDVLLVYLIWAALFAAFADKNVYITTGSHTQVTLGGDQYVVQGTQFWVWIGLCAFVLVDIAVVLEGLTGWTPGKAVCGVRVVKADGSRPGVVRALGRLLAWIIDGIFFYLVAFVTALSSSTHRRVGDMIAGTYVVHAAAAGQPVVPGGAVYGAVAPAGMPVASGVVRDAFGHPVAPTTAPTVSAPAAVVRPADGGARAAVGTESFGAPVQSPGSAGAAPALPPADWYPDPSRQARLRYWDGQAWTAHVAP